MGGMLDWGDTAGMKCLRWGGCVVKVLDAEALDTRLISRCREL